MLQILTTVRFVNASFTSKVLLILCGLLKYDEVGFIGSLVLVLIYCVVVFISYEIFSVSWFKKMKTIH